jgi:hypothetical protein
MFSIFQLNNHALFSLEVRAYAQRVVLWLNTQLGVSIKTVSHKCICPYCENPEHLVNESQGLNNACEKCPAHQEKGCVLDCKCFEFCIPNIDGKFAGCHKHGFEQGCWTEAMRLQAKYMSERDNLMNGKLTFDMLFTSLFRFGLRN